MLRRTIFLMLSSVAAPALASPSFSISDAQCNLGLHCAFTITKTGKAITYSDVAFASSGAAAQSLNLTVRFLRGDTVKTVSDQSLAPGQFTATIRAVRYAAIGRGAAVGTVLGTAPAAPVPLPAPPAPTPVPPAPTGYILSPSLDGAAPIDTSATDDAALQPTWGTGAIPGSSAPDNVGAFRFICQAGQVLPDDPIVFPGKPGASHLHQFYGNTLADAFSSYESLRKTGQSTCNRGVPDPAQRSAYWMPAMLDGSGQVVKPSFVSIYYKRRPASDPIVSDPTNPQYEGKALPVPNGLRFIMGYDMLTGKSPTGELYFNCQGPTSKPGTYPDLPTALANCPVGQGNLLGAVVKAPECWDGKNLDTPNHRDHVSYPSYGTWGYRKCPDGFPYVIPAFTLGAWYPVASGMHLSSDAMVAGAVAGTTFHADFFEAWSPKVKAMWTDNDINKMLNASGGDLGNGWQLKGAQ